MALTDDMSDDLELAPDFLEDELREKLIIDNKDIAREFKNVRFKFALSKKQREDLLQTARTHSLLHELMIETQMFMGLRVSELVNLRIEDVNLGEKILYVRSHKADDKVTQFITKTQAANRMITIEPVNLSKLSGYLKGEKRKTGYFFISQKHCAFRKQTVIAFINKYANETRSIGKNIGSHALRRTFASFMVNNHVPLTDISKTLGHTSIKTTQTYLFHIDSIDGLDRILEGQKKMRESIEK